MIRFKPDSWLDVLMRPFDMVSPERSIYIEISAPDVRMAAVVILSLLVLVFRRSAVSSAKPVLVLLGLLLLASLPWLYTSGNGRYFIPFLILLGPLCMGLIRRLPTTPAFQLTLAGLLVVVQIFLLTESVPWQKWSMGTWREPPYFQVAPPPSQREVNYVTVASISYSLIAPRFPSEAGWMNLVDMGEGPREQAALHRFLGSGRPLVLVAPSIPTHTRPDGQPVEGMRKALGDLVRGQGLTLEPDRSCTLLRSEGLNRATPRPDDLESQNAPVGFWLCPLRYDWSSRPVKADMTNTRTEAIFDAVERLCPRFFRPGEASSQRIGSGYLRSYLGSDTKVYVFDSGVVMYKFWRSLNAQLIGTHDEVLAGKVTVDCSKIRAPNWRRGGP